MRFSFNLNKINCFIEISAAVVVLVDQLIAIREDWPRVNTRVGDNKYGKNIFC